ncbi:Ig-like domain-containing protein [Paenibacillus hexagrammi]|uniref:Ig-like domain-containing protein n=1 Tax=Paenibacillus hexagrammi TaxID=2908839 RepID=A0ABY3SFZ5_9BACL|nr:Ig-like domain-containing protein [Paenibacillus sp. YPD9-1]UJF31857.1 Ig-like domain-containing protein [Paenibacillus sp. YPD9-1]
MFDLIKKLAAILFCMVLIISGNLAWSGFDKSAFASSGTLTFTSNSGFSGSTVTDGQGGSDNIAGIVLQIISGDEYTWTYEKPYTKHVITVGYADNSNQTLIALKSQDSSINFNFQSFFVADSGGTPIVVTGYDNGQATGSVNLDTTQNQSQWENVFDSSNGLTPSIFQNVDEVRITPQDKTAMWIGINDIKIGDPVAINSVTVSPSSKSVVQGGSQQLTATVDAVGGASTTVTWSSSDTNHKVTVDNTGQVNVAADAATGEYTITATSTADGGKKGSALIMVTAAPAVNSVTVSPSSKSVVQGGSQQLTATVDAVGGAPTTVTWSSSDTNHKVTVDNTGQVNVAADAATGEYTITATSTADGSKKGSALITVTAAPNELSGSYLKGDASTLAGQSLDLTYGINESTSDVRAEDITITYDADQFDLDSVKSINEEKFVIVQHKDTAGEVRILGVHLGNSVPTGDLMSVHLKSKVDASGTSTIRVDHVTVASGDGREWSMQGATHTVTIGTVDRAELNALIAEAQAAHDTAVEGTQAGQYPTGEKAKLQEAIDRADEVAADSNANQAEIDQAVANLNVALNAFRLSVIKTTPGDVNENGSTSIGDLAIVAAAYGKTSEDSEWSQYKKFDMNNDGKVDIEDLVIVARRILEE